MPWRIDLCRFQVKQTHIPGIVASFRRIMRTKLGGTTVLSYYYRVSHQCSDVYNFRTALQQGLKDFKRIKQHQYLGSHKRYLYANFEVDRMKHAGTTTNNRGVSLNLDKRTKLSTGERCLPTEGHLQIDCLPLSEATASDTLYYY